MDPGPVCLERLDPDPFKIRPDPKPCTGDLYIKNGFIDTGRRALIVRKQTNFCLSDNFMSLSGRGEV